MRQVGHFVVCFHYLRGALERGERIALFVGDYSFFIQPSAEQFLELCRIDVGMRAQVPLDWHDLQRGLGTPEAVRHDAIPFGISTAALTPGMLLIASKLWLLSLPPKTGQVITEA